MSKQLVTWCHGLGIDDSTYYDMNEGVSKLYKIQSLNLYHYTNSEFSNVLNSLTLLLDQLPESLELKVIVKQRYNHGFYTNSISDSSSAIITKIHYEAQKNATRKTLTKDIFLLVTASKMQKKGIAFFNLTLDKDSINDSYTTLIQAIEVIQTTLNPLNIRLLQQDDKAIFNFFYQLLNGDSFPPVYDAYHFCQNQLLPYPIDVQAEYLKEHDGYTKTLSLHSHTDQIDTWFSIQNLMGYFHGVDYYVSFRKGNLEKQQKTIQLKKQLNALLSRVGASDIGTKNSVYQEQCFDDMLTDLSQSKMPLIDISMGIILRDVSLDNLIKKAHQLRHYFFDKTALIISENQWCHLENLISFLPNQTQFNPHKTAQYSKKASLFFPLGGTWQGFDGDITFQTHRETRLGFSFIDHKAPAGHTLVVGGTGGGKSFFVSWILTQLLANRDNFYLSIIDMGGSYRKLCQMFSGDYIEVRISEQFAVQLFPPKKSIFTNTTIDPDQLMFISQYIKLLIVDDAKHSFSKLEDHVINQAIIKAYDYADIPLLQDFVDALLKISDDETEKITTHFEQSLRLYTKPTEPLSCLFNTKSAIDLSNPLIVFDITHLKDNPQIASLYLQVISNTLRLRMFDHDKTGKSQIVVRDEVWSLFDNPHTCKLISEEYRTARKYKTVLFSISQLVSDYTSEHTDSVLKNSYTKIILENKESLSELKKLGLTEKEASLASAVKRYGTSYSHVYMKYSDIGSEILKIEPTSIEYDICSRDPLYQPDKKELANA